MQNIPVNLLSDDPATQVICIANSTIWTLMTLHGYLPTTPLMSSEGRPTRVDATTRLPSDIHRVFSLWPPPPPGLEGNHSHPGLNTFSRISSSIVNRQIFGILRNKLRQIMRIQLGAENQFWPPHFSDEQSSFTQFHFISVSGLFRKTRHSNNLRKTRYIKLFETFWFPSNFSPSVSLGLDN